MADIINPRGKPISSIMPGSRVVLRNEPDSPVMTAVQPIVPQNPQSNDILGWVVGWFNTSFVTCKDAMGEEVTIANKGWNTIQLPTECLELAKETVQ